MGKSEHKHAAKTKPTHKLLVEVLEDRTVPGNTVLGPTGWNSPVGTLADQLLTSQGQPGSRLQGLFTGLGGSTTGISLFAASQGALSITQSPLAIQSGARYTVTPVIGGTNAAQLSALTQAASFFASYQARLGGSAAAGQDNHDHLGGDRNVTLAVRNANNLASRPTSTST